MDKYQQTIHHLFPTVLFSAQYHKPIKKEILEFTTQQEWIKNTYNLSSKNTFVLKNPLFKKIRKFIQYNIDWYLHNIIKPHWQVKMQITQSWLNASNKGEAHHQHSHANGYLSGVFYINANDTDNISFHRDVNHYSLNIHSEKLDINNSCNWTMPVKTGLLYIFPSTLGHNVNPVQGENTRMSLAFNVFPTGVLGNETNLTKLTIKSYEE